MKNRIWVSGLVTAVCAMSVMAVSAEQGNMTDVYEANQPDVLLKSVDNNF